MSWGIEDGEAEEEEETVDSEPTDETSDDSGGWGTDVQDIDEENEEEDMTNQGVEVTFQHKFLTAVEDGNVEDITVSSLEDNYKELDDASLIRDAVEQDTRSSAEEIYQRRLNQVVDDSEHEEEDNTDLSDEAWDMDDGDQGSDDDEGDDLEEVDQAELNEMGVDSLADDDGDDTTSETEETETNESPSVDDVSGGIDTIDIGDAAPSAMTTDEAAEQTYLWRILGWAQPGKGKTHFAYTMPQPVCIIDTEGKAHNLASKFEDKVTYIWQPDDYDEAREALDEAINVLHKYLEKGHRGTIVVDSMSEMWEWSKQKYVSKAYQGKTLDEVNLSSNMGRSGESDWKVIKRYHNKRFREVMIDTPFHFYWTAMETDDYEAIMEGEDGNPKKPVGERDNAYKVDQVLRFVEGADGEPVGQLQKNGLSKFSYTGLRYPTFDKHQQVCEEIRDLEEQGDDPMIQDVFGGDVRVVEGNPGRWGDE
jgi:hypothetical protein